MALRYYRNGPARSLSFPIALAADTSMTIDSASGFPTQFPYTLIIEPNTALEEVVDVTAAVGNVLTITRGVDSTTASAHAAGSAVWHGVSARDPREANAHVNATTGVHGATGSLVDTDSVQTVIGAKTFTGGLSTTAGLVLTVGGTQAITGTKTFDDLNTTAGGAVVAVGGAQTITGAKVFSGNQTFNGNNVNAGTETHNGANTFAGAVTLSSSVTVGADLLTGAWTAYTPIRRNGTGGATLGQGNGSLVGFYKRIDKTILFRIFLTFGSTSAVGTTYWVFTAPANLTESHQSGSAIIGNPAGTLFGKTWHGIGTNELVVIAEDGSRVSNSSPFGWVGGETVALTGSYETP